MSWAQHRGADREKLNDITPRWTPLLVCSAVRCKLLLPGHFLWQDMWTKNECNMNVNFATQIRIYCEQTKDEDKEQDIFKCLWNKN